MSTITKVKTYDFRFPTSTTLSGSDAMNPDPDYSSAYVEISTSADDGITGVGFVSPSAVATTWFARPSNRCRRC